SDVCSSDLAIQKREYFDMAMDALRVEESGLRQELWKASGARAAGTPAPADDVKKKVVRAEAAAPTVAERRLLELLVHDAELRQSLLPRVEEGDYEEL